MYESCKNKQEEIKSKFSSCENQEDRYRKLMELGRQLKPLASEFKTPENLVRGCQSNVFLRSFLDGDVMIFEADADALISAGLISIVIDVYSGETPETILKCEPAYIKELGIAERLTPGRANGLANMLLRIKQDALKSLI